MVSFLLLAATIAAAEPPTPAELGIAVAGVEQNLPGARESLAQMMTEYRETFDAQVTDVEPWMILALAEYHLGNDEPALSAFQHVLELEPTNVEAAHGSALLLGEAERHSEAATAWLRLHELEPDNTTPLYNAGIRFQLANMPEPAIAQFVAVLAVEPDDHRARERLIQLYQATGDTVARDDAIEDLMALYRAGRDPLLQQRRAFAREQQQVHGFNMLSFQTLEPGPEDPPITFTLLDAQDYTVAQLALMPPGPEASDFTLQARLADGTRWTYGHYPEAPDYDRMRTDVLTVLAGDTLPTEGPAQSTR